MVVDDNTFMRNLLIDTIKVFGIENTVGARDCAAAIKRFEAYVNHRTEVIFLAGLPDVAESAALAG